MIVPAILVAAMLLLLLALLYSVTRDRDHFEAENRELRNMLDVARMLIVEFRDAELDERTPPKVMPATLSIAGAWIERANEFRSEVV